jgi:hypothetical protein
MPHVYLLFDFARDEEKAQQARHKLESWKQAFRLDKKLLYKLERTAPEAAATGGEAEPEPQKPAKAEARKEKGKSKGKAAAKTEPEPAAASSNQDVKLLIRLAFSGHEKLTEQRWIQRIPSEEPFEAASPKVIKVGDDQFEATETQFEELP